MKASRLGKLRQYVWYAIGEVVLIFAGITLALAFGNWNEERQLRNLERRALADIAANLEVNVQRTNRNIGIDSDQMKSCERVLETLSMRTPWQETTAKDLFHCRWWTSPYLNKAAYGSLKSRGTDLVSDPELRYSILDLYEVHYPWIENDIDKTMWNFQTSVMEPVFNRYVGKVLGSAQYVPNDYPALLESNEFSNMLRMKIHYQVQSIGAQMEIVESTERVIKLIELQLSQ